MNWISVKERLPQALKDVLLHYNGHVVIGHVDEDGVFWWDNSYDFYRLENFDKETFSDAVTHWMPLPPPPAGK